MSLTVFLAICVLGFDFLLYVLFQWIYGEKYRKHSRRIAARREKRRTHYSKGAQEPRVLPFPERPIQHRAGHLIAPPSPGPVIPSAARNLSSLFPF